MPPFPLHLWLMGSGLAPRQQATLLCIYWPYHSELRQPGNFWPVLLIFLNHQNFGYETCCSWNNLTCGVHFALIINFSFHSPPLCPYQKTSQASSLAWRLALSSAASICLCASLWSTDVICPPALWSDLLLGFSKAAGIFEKPHSCCYHIFSNTSFLTDFVENSISFWPAPPPHKHTCLCTHTAVLAWIENLHYSPFL